MFKNIFFPLRTIIGPSIPVQVLLPSVKVVAPDKLIFNNNPDLSGTINNPAYLHFLPDILSNGILYHPLPGMNTMPLHDSNVLPMENLAPSALLNIFKNNPDHPFNPADPVCSIFAYREDNFVDLKLTAPANGANTNNHLLSNLDKSYSFLVMLSEEQLVGGICFSGYPFISSHINNNYGMTVGNFGLPKEIRLTPLPSFSGKSLQELTGFQRAQFIDAEFAYTRQEIISHSGFNYLTIDPVKTNLFLLTITDLPFITRHIDLDKNQDPSGTGMQSGFKGFAIPYLYFFQYKESTKRSARLPSGLLGVKNSAAPLKEDGSIDRLRSAFPEYEYVFTDEKKKEGYYILYTAHSALGQRREFQVSYADLNYPAEVEDIPVEKNKKTLTECFISDLLQQDETITLFIQQGEEYDRCVAGIKALFLLVPPDNFTEAVGEQFANYFGIGLDDNQLADDERTFLEDALAYLLNLPPEINFCERIGIKIYSLDPADGVSPVSVPLDSKYSCLLLDTILEDTVDVILNHFLRGLQFKSVSTSKYFAVELTNKGKAPGQVAIHSLQLTRSAHVSVQSRPGKSQQVKTMHYRLIGPEIADDYSRLGSEGFNFTIDKLVAGQRKSVIYSAMSLLDLLHTGGARIHSNVRRRAIEFEKIENYQEKDAKSPPYLVKKIGSDDFSTGNFENRETDINNISWRSIESGKDVAWPLTKGLPGFTFENYSATENRSRTEQISSLGDAFITAFNNLNNNVRQLLSTVLPLPSLISVTTASQRLFNNNTNTALWKPFNAFGFNINNLPPINGIQVLNIPPFYLSHIDLLARLLNPLRNQFQPSMAAPQLPTLSVMEIDDMIAKLSLVNGLSMGMNLGGSFSVTVPVPPPLSFSGGVSGGYSMGVNSTLAASIRNSTSGSVGSVVLSGQETKYSLNRNNQSGFDNNISQSFLGESEQKRIVTRRELLDRDHERTKGAEVMWQDKIQDIITGTIPLNFSLPAISSNTSFRTSDEALRVRFNSGLSPSVEVDFWFELIEENIKDDN